ncbi:serine/threonine-protein kinase [Streptomyces sp. ISL-11]|uniref:serine/threonine-protein kinase n=1 Tax=Streptomyces sp. ISL-11 TaxID=2819174 RepID=UPI001BE76A99|nr:serine/threonine-protein kinase [Streptomyces sp. ISL-11]MBT2384895.1 serine/threonine protein kinase [Streptomyces sp. ISL-11]
MTNDGGWANEPTSYDLQPPAPVPARSAAPAAPQVSAAPHAPGFPPAPQPGHTPPAPRTAGHPYTPATPPAPQPTVHAPAPEPSAAEPGSGRLLGGRYRLVSRLGHGGMGTVWKARDEVVDRDVAVKEPRVPDHLPEYQRQNVHQRMQREARAAARIDHPSVVTVHDVVVEDGRPWIVMELVRGRSLGDVLAEGTLDPREAARIGLAVLGALAAAHEAGVLHRDVKPDNVLLGPNERVVLTDFGIAQIEGEQGLTETGAFVGSPEYVAPERVLGQRPGPESDLWSLGVVLYAAVEGVSPFRRSNTPATLQSILSTEPQTPARGSGELGTIVMGLLRKDPASRPTQAQVRQVLDAVARPAPQSAAFTATRPQATGSKWMPPVLQGNRKAQWGLGGGVVAVAAAAALFIVNPFAVGPAVPLHWKVVDEPEIVKASLTVPEDYTKKLKAEDGLVEFGDPSGVFHISLDRDTLEQRRKSVVDKEPKDIGSADVEAKRIADHLKSGSALSVNDAKSTTAEAARHQGMDAAEVVTVYRESGDSEEAPKSLLRTQVIVNDAKTASWTLRVTMPEKGEGRKNGDKLFEDVLKYLKIKEQ